LKYYLLTLVTLACLVKVEAQKNDDNKGFVDAIEDNSFFIEEAYNQEYREVQHISTAYFRTQPSRDFYYSFTQEWPAFGVKHQLSYTIPYSVLDRNRVNGIGDIYLNYRYQLFYEEDWACVSPRLSLILPTGNSNKGLGQGVPGMQISIPLSKRLSDMWVMHLNAGTTVLPKVRATLSNETQIKKTLYYYNLGVSIIWLANANFNIMLEGVQNFNSAINTDGKIERSTETIINPGLRAAINLGNLQIVPGIAVPFFISDNKLSTGMWFYLSFEHSY
jgi:hypothetical protein